MVWVKAVNRDSNPAHGAQQMGLGAKRTAGKPAGMGALGHEANQELLGLLWFVW